ncbi:MAG: TolC family protein [Ignavibacteriae bacterium]|nr:TolC family protein [Ignavibacteriota bacterium]
MNIKKYIAIVFVGVSFLTSIIAQENLTLSDAINIGLENNYNILIAKKDVQIADENNSWGAVGLYPTIDVSVTSLNRFDDNGSSEVTTNNILPSAQLNWVLFNGFKVYNSKRRLEDAYNLTKGFEAITVENNIQSIILAYYDVLLQQERLKVFDEIEKLSKDRYDRTLLSKELGSSITYEVLQAKNSWLEDRSAYLSQKLNFDNTVRMLNLLIGEKNDKSYNFVDSFRVETYNYNFEDLKTKMFASNKTLKNQYINQIISERNIDIASGDFYPTLRLSSGYDYESANQKINSLPRSKSTGYDYYGNLILSWNLFNGLNTRRSLEIAKIENEVSKIETEQIEHSLNNTLTQLYELYNIRKELLNVSEENLDAAKLNLQISEEKLKNGSISSFNYRDVQIIYLNAAIQKLNAIYNLKETDTELARLTGSIVSEE